MSSAADNQSNDNLVLLDTMIRSDGLPFQLIGDNFALSHFNSPQSYARHIVRLINEGDFFKTYLKNKTNLTILDLGANIGLFTIYAAPSASRIVSVEPTPGHARIMKMLTKNIPNITIVEEAVSNTNAPVVFYLSAYNTTMNSLFNHANTGQIAVNGKTIKTIMDEQNLTTVDLCKIDIEGSEMIAITADSLAEVDGRIKAICIEVHQTSSSLEHNMNIISGIFTNAGYSIEYLKGDGGRLDTIFAEKL